MDAAAANGLGTLPLALHQDAASLDAISPHVPVSCVPAPKRPRLSPTEPAAVPGVDEDSFERRAALHRALALRWSRASALPGTSDGLAALLGEAASRRWVPRRAWLPPFWRTLVAAEAAETAEQLLQQPDAAAAVRRLRLQLAVLHSAARLGVPPDPAWAAPLWLRLGAASEAGSSQEGGGQPSAARLPPLAAAEALRSLALLRLCCGHPTPAGAAAALWRRALAGCAAGSASGPSSSAARNDLLRRCASLLAAVGADPAFSCCVPPPPPGPLRDRLAASLSAGCGEGGARAAAAPSLLHRSVGAALAALGVALRYEAHCGATGHRVDLEILSSGGGEEVKTTEVCSFGGGGGGGRVGVEVDGPSHGLWLASDDDDEGEAEGVDDGRRPSRSRRPRALRVAPASALRNAALRRAGWRLAVVTAEEWRRAGACAAAGGTACGRAALLLDALAAQGWRPPRAGGSSDGMDWTM